MIYDKTKLVVQKVTDYITDNLSNVDGTISHIEDRSAIKLIRDSKILVDVELYPEVIDTVDSVMLQTLFKYIAYTGVSPIHLDVGIDTFRELRDGLAQCITNGNRLGVAPVDGIPANKDIIASLDMLVVISDFDFITPELIKSARLNKLKASVYKDVTDVCTKFLSANTSETKLMVNRVAYVLEYIGDTGGAPKHIPLSADDFSALRAYVKLNKIKG